MESEIISPIIYQESNPRLIFEEQLGGGVNSDEVDLMTIGELRRRGQLR